MPMGAGGRASRILLQRERLSEERSFAVRRARRSLIAERRVAFSSRRSMECGIGNIEYGIALIPHSIFNIPYSSKYFRSSLCKIHHLLIRPRPFLFRFQHALNPQLPLEDLFENLLDRPCCFG